MKSAKPTPRPWMVHQHYPKMIHNGKVQIANMGPTGSLFPVRDFSERVKKANAVFIVLAANCHEDLLEACREAFQMIELIRQGDSMVTLDTKNIEAAIAKAEGGK